MHPIASALRRRGHTVTNWGYPSWRHSIDEIAASLTLALSELAKGGEPISFVTHSLGGIILRAALNRSDCPIEARRGGAILLAPPNSGSQLAKRLYRHPITRIGMGKGAGRDLGLGLVEEVAPFPPETRVLVIAGTRDGKVTLEETALATPHERIEGPYSHTWIMRHHTVVKAAADFL